jgi:hypothetical protein
MKMSCSGEFYGAAELLQTPMMLAKVEYEILVTF